MQRLLDSWRPQLCYGIIVSYLSCQIVKLRGGLKKQVHYHCLSSVLGFSCYHGCPKCTIDHVNPLCVWYVTTAQSSVAVT